ncbi:hypothetical protein VTK56DRAFT_5039 [Thermocarpiscus australiensis]
MVTAYLPNERHPFYAYVATQRISSPLSSTHSTPRQSNESAPGSSCSCVSCVMKKLTAKGASAVPRSTTNSSGRHRVPDPGATASPMASMTVSSASLDRMRATSSGAWSADGRSLRLREGSSSERIATGRYTRALVSLPLRVSPLVNSSVACMVIWGDCDLSMVPMV